MTKVVIDVPQGLETAFLEKAEQLIVEMEAEAEAAQLRRLAETDDRAMIDYLKLYYQNHSVTQAVVRAQTYKTVRNSQEFCGTYELGDKRPVLMRGSIAAMQARYTTKGSMAEQIAKRFLRRIKFTALTVEPIEELERRLIPKLRNNWYVHSTFRLSRPGILGGSDRAYIWLGGEWTHIPAEKYEQVLRLADQRDAAELAQQRILEKKQRTLIREEREREQKYQDQTEEQRQSRRKRRAAEIAAYELMLEIGATK